MRQNFDGFQVRAADDPPSALAVVLDTAITSWIPTTEDASPHTPQQAASTLQAVTEQLLIFLNTFILQHDGNRVYVILVSGEACDLVFPLVTSDVEIDSLPSDYDASMEDDMFEASSNAAPGKLPVNPMQAMRALREAVINGVKSSIEKQGMPGKSCEQTVKVSTALARALCLLNRARKLRAMRAAVNAGKAATAASSAASAGMLLSTTDNNDVDIPANGRVLTIVAGLDSPEHYVPMMNCMFSAQRIKVPIDSCVISPKDSTYLQQAAHLTDGVYMRVERDSDNETEKSEVSDTFLQTLQTVFLTDKQSRDFVAMPTPESVDFRASCMKTRKIIEDGYTCSVCLSTFGKETKGTPMCPVCSARYVVIPPRARRRR